MLLTFSTVEHILWSLCLTLSLSSSIQAQYKPRVTVSQTKYTINEDSSVTMNCGVVSQPVASSVWWMRDNAILDRTSGRFSDGNTAESPSLTISSMQHTDKGVYVCVAQNSVGTTESENVNLIVRYAPKLTISGGLFVADLGQSVDIPCEIDAYPLVDTVRWYKVKDGVKSQINTNSTLYSGGNVSNPGLRIISLDLADSANYLFQAENAIGTGESNTVFVRVSYKPRITSDTKALEANETQTLIIMCNVMANPQITNVIWKKNLQDLDISGGKYIGGTSSNPSLTISNVAESDAGQYVCRVVNSQGITESDTVKVSINYYPRNLEVIPSQNVNIKEGGSVNLTCSANAVPEASYKWIKAGRDHQQGKDLVISNATQFDSAEYTCVAENILGSNNITSTVHILFGPETVSISGNRRVQADGQNMLALICTSSSSSPGVIFIWRNSSDNSVISGPNPGQQGQALDGGHIYTSQLTITPQWYQHGDTIKCEARNLQFSEQTPSFDTVQLDLTSENIFLPFI